MFTTPKRLVAPLLAFVAGILTASAQIGGTGWTPKTPSFKIQSPTNAPQSERYWFTNKTYHFLTYSNDGAFAVGNTTLPRTEHRYNPDYTNGEIQYQANFMVPEDENSYSIFQIHTGDAQSSTFGSTTFMVFWFTNSGGSIRYYSGTVLATNLANKWFQLNVDHNLVTHTLRAWVNKKLVYTGQDNGATDFYFKAGVYEQKHGPTLRMDSSITNILIWTSSGTNPYQPTITQTLYQDGKVLISGTGGQPNAPYAMLASTNVSQPFAQWAPIGSNSFDNTGAFTFTNTPATNSPQLYYRLQTP